MLIFLQRWPDPNFLCSSLECLDLYQGSLVLLLALADDPSEGDGQLLPGHRIGCQAEVGSRCPVVRPSYPG